MTTPNELSKIRLARVARVAGKLTVWGLALLAALVMALLLSINSEVARSVILARANAALAQTFAGRVQIDKISRIGLDGIAGIDARVFDPKGKQVIAARGLTVRLNLPGLGWHALFGKSALRVNIRSISLDHAELVLLDDGKGSPTLARTFEPRAPSREAQPGATVVIQRITVRHVWVHGALRSAPPVDLELLHLDGSLENDPVAMAVSLDRLGLRMRGLPRVMAANGELRGVVRLKSGSPGDMHAEATFQGEIGGIASRISGSLHGQALRASLSAPAISPIAASRLIPGLAPRNPLALTVDVHGTLPKVAFHARASGAAGSIDTTGSAGLGEKDTLETEVHVQDLDLAELVARAPRTHIDLTLSSALASAPDRAIAGDYRIVMPASRVGDSVIPAVSVQGKVGKDSRSAWLEGIANVAEAGAPTRVEFAFRDLPSGAELEFGTATKLERPPRLAALARGLSISGVMESRARLELKTGELRGLLRARLRDLEQGQNSMASLVIRGEVAGALAAPELGVDARAQRILVGSRRFASLRVEARGKPEQLRINASATGEHPETSVFQGVVSLRPSPAIEGATLTLSDHDTEVILRAPAIRFASGKLSVERLTADGAGHAELSLIFGKRLESALLETKDLDISRWARLLGVRSPFSSGKLMLDARYLAARGGDTGHVQGKLSDVGLGRIQHGAVRTDITLQGGRASGALDIELAKCGSAHITANDLALFQPALFRGDLSRFTGRVELRSKLDLDYLTALTEDDRVPLGTLRGKVNLELKMEHTAADPGLPSVVAHLETHSLELGGKREDNQIIESTSRARLAEPWAVQG
ncbi:MAG TPA: hypothetical protein VGJ84_19810, partial [Polyangiaceae bacterium]